MFDLRIDQEAWASQFDEDDQPYADKVRAMTYEQWTWVETKITDEIYADMDVRDGIYDAIDNCPEREWTRRERLEDQLARGGLTTDEMAELSYLRLNSAVTT